MATVDGVACATTKQALTQETGHRTSTGIEGYGPGPKIELRQKEELSIPNDFLVSTSIGTHGTPDALKQTMEVKLICRNTHLLEHLASTKELEVKFVFRMMSHTKDWT